MTTFSALMGAVPIALGIGGMSAEGRRPLGLVIIGGLIVSQILTLYLTPILYLYLEKLREKLHQRNNLKNP
jgi:HAE1 family hydrophobic/amphiphilic exporter-1